MDTIDLFRDKHIPNFQSLLLTVETKSQGIHGNVLWMRMLKPHIAVDFENNK